MWPEDDNFIDNCFDLPYSKQVNRKQNKEFEGVKILTHPLGAEQ